MHLDFIQMMVLYNNIEQQTNNTHNQIPVVCDKYSNSTPVGILVLCHILDTMPIPQLGQLTSRGLVRVFMMKPTLAATLKFESQCNVRHIQSTNSLFPVTNNKIIYVIASINTFIPIHIKLPKLPTNDIEIYSKFYII